MNKIKDTPKYLDESKEFLKRRVLDSENSMKKMKLNRNLIHYFEGKIVAYKEILGYLETLEEWFL